MESKHGSGVKCDKQLKNNDKRVELTQIKTETIESNNYECVGKFKLNCQVSTRMYSNRNSGIGNIHSNNNINPKMGSRRIFSPTFKLQVLESYRHDNDCKGNQRATARKYNIHRRQIQKWLQCEPSLRSSVANINQNTIRHQFHNINLGSKEVQIPSSCGSESTSYISYQYNQEQERNDILSDKSINSVNPVVVPSLRQDLAESSSPTPVFATTNLAAVVAAAAVAGAAGALAIASSAPTCTSASATTIISPIRPTALVGSNSGVATSSSFLPSHNNHHYNIPPFMRTSADLSESVHALTHYIPLQRQHYQYHSLSQHVQMLTRQHEHQRSLVYMPSASLPITVLSTAAENNQPRKMEEEEEKQNTTDNDLFKSTTYINSSPKGNNINVHDNDYMPNRNENCGYDMKNNQLLPCYFKQQYHLGYSLFPVSPMDLSLGTRNNICNDALFKIKPDVFKNDDDNFITKYDTDSVKEPFRNESVVVDLTFRKRKVFVDNSVPNLTDDNEQPEKQSKFLSSKNGNIGYNHSVINLKNIGYNYGESSNNRGNNIKLEIEMKEKGSPSKPVKLFKPYLLDDNNGDNTHITTADKELQKSGSNTLNRCELRLTPHNHDNCLEGVHGNNFHTHINEKYVYSNGSPLFLTGSKTTTPQSAFSPTTSASALSPIIFHCPKGSPISSGYESSSSTYSESSSSYRSEQPFRNVFSNRPYSFNIQMHSTHRDNVIRQQSNHVQRWLDQDISNPPASNASIALYA